MAEQNLDEQFAALDLGSNSFHLLVAKEQNGQMQVVDKYKEMVRLAEGLTEGGGISDAAQQRALDCLERLGERLRGINPANLRIVGTNALRQAKQAEGFFDAAERLVGHQIEVISGREEARLIYLGVSYNLDDSHDRRLVVDIGGGSTELILGRDFVAKQMESLHMGCVSMSARCFAEGKISKKNFERAIDLARQELEPVSLQFQPSEWDTAIGASGTIVTVGEILSSWFDDVWHITPDGLGELINRLIATKDVDRIELPHLSQERAPVFCGGVAILAAIFRELGVESMQTASGALREGVIYDLLGRAHRQDIRNATVANLMQRYHIDQNHSARVRELAISLLAQTANAWQLTEPSHQQILTWAADLHEIGMDISHSQFHKHGGYLLENLDMPGFSRPEQIKLATLVRAHRRKYPTELFSEDDPPTSRLAVLLRLSALLRRSRSPDPLPHVGIAVDDRNVTVTLPSQWLENHPLTRLDLEQEATYLSGADLTLVVTGS